MTDNNSPRMIPNWLWAVMACAIVGVSVALFLTDRRPEPGPALRYDVSEYEVVEEHQVHYEETARYGLDLETPTGLTLTPEGLPLVCGDTHIVALDAQGRERSRRALSFQPHCIACAADGALYIGARQFVARAPSFPDELISWEPLDEETWLTALAVNEQYVYAADSGYARVLQYDHDGRLVREIGGRRAAEGAPRFVVPSHYLDIAFDSQTTLWISNPGRLGIENFRDDGTLISEWHQPGMRLEAFSGCCNPIHFTFKRNNTLVTAEKGLNRVKTFNADRSFAGVVAPPEHLNTGWRPSGDTTEPAPIRDLAVDLDDRILVLHGPLRAILVFEEKPVRKDAG